jgi:Fe-S-cluster containining protein
METFQCIKCGNCCRPHGYVRLKEGEAELIAGYEGMDILQFVKECARLTDDRTSLSLNEKTDGSCIFLAGDNTCVINDVKPRQCRDFPGNWRYDGYEKICGALHESGHNRIRQ